jgi:hypothetical protein
MGIERIVTTGDVFRTADGDANQLYNTRWLHAEISRQLCELTGLSADIAFRRNAPDDGRAVIAEWYRMLDCEPSMQAWAATYGLTAPPPALIEALRPDYEGALVVGFELSPLIRSVLAALDAPWIDVEVSPIRFLEDLALTLRFSWPVEIAHPGVLSAHDVREAVARVRARHSDAGAVAGLRGACIFLGQTRHDRTLIKGSRFFPDGEAIEAVARSLDGRPLVIKPHPLAPNNPLLSSLSSRFAAPTTGANVYTLLAAAVDVQFLTISSSAAVEARHFGHTPEIFNEGAHADAEAMTSMWAHRSSTFWRAALAPVLPLERGTDIEERTIPDRLRRSLGGWGWPPPEGGPQASAAAAPKTTKGPA